VTSFNDVLGLAAGEAGEVVLDTRPEHQVAPGTIHFAVLATLAEVSAAHAVGAPVVPATVSLSLLARAQPGRLVGRGRLLRRGRTLAVAEGEVLQADRLVAKATVTFALLGG
jgi:acyl-coenzyme A thioesterase PaaI-like protein